MLLEGGTSPPTKHVSPERLTSKEVPSPNNANNRSVSANIMIPNNIIRGVPTSTSSTPVRIRYHSALQRKNGVIPTYKSPNVLKRNAPSHVTQGTNASIVNYSGTHQTMHQSVSTIQNNQNHSISMEIKVSTEPPDLRSVLEKSNNRRHSMSKHSHDELFGPESSTQESSLVDTNMTKMHQAVLNIITDTLDFLAVTMNLKHLDGTVYTSTRQKVFLSGHVVPHNHIPRVDVELIEVKLYLYSYIFLSFQLCYVINIYRN